MNNQWTEQSETGPVASLSFLKSQPKWKTHHIHHLSYRLLHNRPVSPVRFLLTCVGDLGRAGAGDAGASIWLGLAVGLGKGETSSGGDGVFAMRSGPESLDGNKATVRTYISCWLITLTVWCNSWAAALMQCQWPQNAVHTGDEQSYYIMTKTKTAIKFN